MADCLRCVPCIPTDEFTLTRQVPSGHQDLITMPKTRTPHHSSRALGASVRSQAQDSPVWRTIPFSLTFDEVDRWPVTKEYATVRMLCEGIHEHSNKALLALLDGGVVTPEWCKLFQKVQNDFQRFACGVVEPDVSIFARIRPHFGYDDLYTIAALTNLIDDFLLALPFRGEADAHGDDGEARRRTRLTDGQCRPEQRSGADIALEPVWQDPLLSLAFLM